jgi:hypothetical protein
MTVMLMCAAPAIAEGFCTAQAVCEQNPTLARAEIPTQHSFGVFLSRQES